MRHLTTAAGILIFSAGLIAARPSATFPPSSVQPTSELKVITSKPTSVTDKEEILNMTHKNVNEKQTETWKPTESHLDNPNYFEGDLDVPQEMIDAFYGNSNATNVSNINHNNFVMPYLVVHILLGRSRRSNCTSCYK